MKPFVAHLGQRGIGATRAGQPIPGKAFLCRMLEGELRDTSEPITVWNVWPRAFDPGERVIVGEIEGHTVIIAWGQP